VLQECEHSGKAAVLKAALLRAFPGLAAPAAAAAATGAATGAAPSPPTDLTSLTLRILLAPGLPLDAAVSEAPAAFRLAPVSSAAAARAARTEGLVAGWDVESEEERGRGGAGSGSGGSVRALALPGLTARDLAPGAYPGVLVAGGGALEGLLGSQGGSLFEEVERVVCGPPEPLPEVVREGGGGEGAAGRQLP
jgi:hypothetical protein